MKLSKRNRIDTLTNEVRRRGNKWDRLIYFGLVGLFLGWVVDLMAGDYFYLHADGLVLRDRLVLATQFTSQVGDLSVIEGGPVKRGQVVARLKSEEVEQTLARLSAEITNAMTRRSTLSVRQDVIAATRDSAEQTYQAAHATNIQTRQLINARLISNKRVSELMESEFRTSQTLAELQAEEVGIERDLPQLEGAIVEATAARERLKESYNDGKIIAPADGIVGSLPVRPGSVARTGEPLMELYTGETYVLSYVPEGALYDLSIGTPVNITVGFQTYSGHVKQILPVSSQLPQHFQDAIRPPARAQVMYVAFEPGQPLPTLFAKPKISGTGWFWPRWAGGTTFGFAKAALN
jgi:multidrug resistance efflux pump